MARNGNLYQRILIIDRKIRLKIGFILLLRRKLRERIRKNIKIFKKN